MFGGKLYVAILSLLLTPIIARLFEPKDYGEFALYNTVVQNLVVVGTLSLPLAISTVKKENLEKVFNLTITVILFFTVVFTLGLIIFKSPLDSVFSTTIFSKYWGLILIGFVVTAVAATLKALNIRLKHFKLNSKVIMLEGSSAKIVNLGSGWLGLNAIGLIFSDVISKLLGLAFLLNKTKVKFSFSISGAKKTLRKFNQFPRFVMPSQWVGMLNNQFIIIAVAILFSKNELGQLAMAIGLLGIPLHLFSNAFQPVITERLTSLRTNSVKLKPFFKNTSFIIFTIAALVFIPILALPTSTFTFILGAKWVGISTIINSLAIYYIFLLLDQSLENGFIVFNKQKTFLYFSLIELIFQLLITHIAYLLKLPFIQLIILITIARSLVSVTRVMYLYQNLKSNLIEL